MDYIAEIKKKYPFFNKITHSFFTAEEGKKLKEFFKLKSKHINSVCALHDIGKAIPYSEALEFITVNKIKTDEFKGFEKEMAHCLISGFIAEKYFHINCKQSLFAVKYHTTGHPLFNEELLTVYVADYIERSRKFKKAEEIRKKVYGLKTIKEAAFCVAENKLMHLREKKYKIHPLTLKFKRALSI